MMNTIMKRILSLALAMLCLAGLCINLIPGRADAATVGNSASSISVNSSGMYVVKNKTALRSSTGKIYSTYATLEKGTLVEGCGCSRDGKFIMVNAGGKTYWVKRSDLYDAGKTRAAKIYYCTKSVVLRNGPYEKAAKVTSLAKGSVIAVVGTVKNSYGHTWYAVYCNGHIRYLFATGNVKAASKIELKVTGSKSNLMAGDKVQLSYKVNHKVNVTWSSSNKKVATVDISGRVTGVGDGTCEIRATVGGVVTTSYKVQVTSYQTQINNAYKTAKKVAGRKSFNGYCGLFTGCMVQAVGITKECNTQNGKDQYDHYKNMSKTSGGYKVTAYSASRYSLKEALNAISQNGKKNVTNLLVGFQRTNSGDGKKFGHALFIHAIIDGKVYFSESFSARVAGKRYAEGAPIVCTISEFISYYSSWTTYEGIIWFTK